MAAIQSRLLASVHAHRYSSSVANIRLENWWSHNRKGYTGSVINFFNDMVATGEFNLGNTLHMEIAWCNFSPLLQYEIDQPKFNWSTHYIRRARHDTIPGRPDKMCFYQNYLEVKTKEQILVIQRFCIFRGSELYGGCCNCHE